MKVFILMYDDNMRGEKGIPIVVFSKKPKNSVLLDYIPGTTNVSDIKDLFLNGSLWYEKSEMYDINA